MQHIDQSKVYDRFLNRQVKLMATIGPSALPPDQLDRVSLSDSLKSNLINNISSTPVQSSDK